MGGWNNYLRYVMKCNIIDTRLTEIIFDLDGTIIDSAPSILKTLEDVCYINSIVPKVAIDEQLIGGALKEVITKISGDADLEVVANLIDDFKYVYDNYNVQLTTAFDGIEEQLLIMKELGLNLHIATNKRLTPSEKILHKLDLYHFFDSIYAIDCGVNGYTNKSEMIGSLILNEKIRINNSCYIGDRDEDALAAGSNGLPFFYASWGYDHSRQHAEKYCVITSVDKIVESIRDFNIFQ